jgi:tripartite-type tricarboxylate transporter receptor subunit TctC
MLMSTLLPPLPHLKTNRLRAIGVTSAKRLASLPEVPALAEGVPGYEVVGWYGMVAPANTPRPVVAKLQKEIASILQAADTREKLAADGAEPVGSSPEEFGAFIKSELVKWAGVVKAAKMPME